VKKNPQNLHNIKNSQVIVIKFILQGKFTKILPCFIVPKSSTEREKTFHFDKTIKI